MKTTRLPFVAAFAAYLVSTVDLRAAIIDTFTAVKDGNPDAVSLATSGNVVTDFVITPTVTDPIGSRRRLDLTQSAPGQSASLTIDGLGLLTSTASTLASSDWTITYGVGLIPGLGFDATAGGATTFRLSFASFDPDMEVLVAAFSSSGAGTGNMGLFTPIAATMDFPFSNFSNLANVTFNNLNQITFRVRDAGLNKGGIASVDTFETVPEPGSAVLLLGGALLLARRRRG